MSVGSIYVTVKEEGRINVTVKEEGRVKVAVYGGGRAVEFKVAKFVGDNSETEFDLTAIAMTNSYLVLLNGIPQEESVEYTINSARNKITFITAPKLNWKIEVRYATIN